MLLRSRTRTPRSSTAPTGGPSGSSRSIWSRWRASAASRFRTRSFSSAPRVFAAAKKPITLWSFSKTPARCSPAPSEEQPAKAVEIATGKATELQLKRAVAAVEMARYYEDARRLAQLLTQWAKTIPSRKHRFVVTSGGGPGIMEAANRGA